LSDDAYISGSWRWARPTTNLFSYAIAANASRQAEGNAVVDGYDSSLGNYDPVTNRTASGGIATNSKQLKAIDVGSAHLGKAVTGPADRIRLRRLGRDLSWESPGIQPDWVNNDMNVQFQPNSAPSEHSIPGLPRSQ
jgi:hypothetical protein